MLASLFALAAGCASVPPDAGFPAVRDAVLARTGAGIEWRRTGVAPEVAARVRELLAAELTPAAAFAVVSLNNRELQATLDELGVAQADLLEAGLLRNPVLGGEWRSPGSPVHPFEISIAQPILELFLLPLRKRVAAHAFAAAQLRLTDAVLGLEAETRSSVLRLQAAEQALALDRTAAGAAATSADLAGRQHAAGNLNDLDLATHRAMAAESQLEVTRAEIERGAAREHLERLMGLDGTEPAWRVAAAIPPLPEEDVALAGLEDRALAGRRDLAALRREADALAAALPASRAAGLEEVQVGAHRERDAEGGQTTGPAVAVSVPLFNWGQAARRRAEARARQAENRYQAKAAEARSEVRQAWGRLAVARREAELYRDSLVPLSHSVVALTQTHYNAMLAGVFELLAAKRGALRAERGAVEALRDYWLARVQLERVLADRLPVPAGAPARGDS